MLTIDSVSKAFGGIHALDRVSMKVEKGQIYGIIGPNGAGKSTLFRLISGTMKPDDGNIILNDRDITGLGCVKINRLGVGYVFQETFLFNAMTLGENMMISGSTNVNHGLLSLIPFYQSKRVQALEERILSTAREFKLESKVDLLPSELSYGDRRRALIAHALINEASLLLLDEPSAGMNSTERKDLTNDILRARDRGHTIMIIEHNLRLIMGICDRITVLNFGKVICEGKPEEVTSDQKVREAYMGRKHE